MKPVQKNDWEKMYRNEEAKNKDLMIKFGMIGEVINSNEGVN